MQPTWQTPDGSIRLYLGDCLRVMPELEAGIDAVIADLPYGTTACKWDTVIPFEPLWENYKRLVKRNAAIVLTATQPFASALVMSNPKSFRYQWVWDRVGKVSGHLDANRRPLRRHELVLVFGDAQAQYFPIKTRGAKRRAVFGSPVVAKNVYGTARRVPYESDIRFPVDILAIKADDSRHRLHPTQKPVALMEYLIRTYTNEGETVLDNTMGSGTTGIACIRTARKFVGIEKEPEIFATAVKRFEAELSKQPLLEGVA